MPKILFGTIALEINRWSSRIPSYSVSDWVGRFKADGFDGLELWENHVLLHPSRDGEINKIIASGFPVSVYNTYAAFDDESRGQRETAAETVKRLNAGAVKYNVGADESKIGEYKRNLISFAEALPDNCKLLCECHAGTVLEDNDAAAKFFGDLPEERFGVILHPFECPNELRTKFKIFGSRIKHIHSQITDGTGSRVRLDRLSERALACLGVMKEFNFYGSFTIEFTEGTSAPSENIDGLYENAMKDMRFIRENYMRGADEIFG